MFPCNLSTVVELVNKFLRPIKIFESMLKIQWSVITCKTIQERIHLLTWKILAACAMIHRRFRKFEFTSREELFIIFLPAFRIK